MSKSTDLKIKALKSSICQITSHHTGGERARQDLALSVFVKFSLGVMLNQLVSRYRHYGITDLELAEHITIDDTHFALDRKLFDTLNPEALATSVRLYKELVEALPAFSDVLMSVIEEMYLANKSGEGLGQYLTPPDVAYLIDELIEVSESNLAQPRNEPYGIQDDCSGAGSLTLPRAKTEAAKGRQRIRMLNVKVKDLDPFMCCAAALQFVANIVVHEQDLHQLQVTCSNALTETEPHSKSMVVIKTPDKIFERVRLAHANIIFESQNRIKHFNSLTNKILRKEVIN
ncbi:N-6 DNA methylase [Pseudomonas syringae]|uniref:DNA methylase adenine-specific domain-containing protein n=1 Tax=Pseudomonas syringae TaxID=317 RepID=A0A085VF45_PSESX|nr:N-6 DNA methylase [Pseudomonas syringae]KFE54058.1 hypothetical protein IV02_04745 [Pseudomonas syringae]